MTPSLDHFTPLSRAVASIDRDAYAVRYAIYDREYKALLRRLATAATPVSDADLAREELAFRDAVRRVEFGDEDAPSLVPREEPVEEPSPEQLLRALVVDAPSGSVHDEVWPRLPPQRRESPEFSPVLQQDQVEGEAASSVETLLELSAPRSLARRVGERLALAVLVLCLLGAALRFAPEREVAATVPSAPSAPPAPETALRTEQAAETTESVQAPQAKLQQPQWLSPEMFFTPLPTPAAPQSTSPPPTSAPLPRADVPLPTPRPQL